MRSVIGWMAALFASALLGAAVYQTVLSTPQRALDPTATVETVGREPGPQPTLYRTEVRTVVEPTPTETVVEQVLIEEEAVPVSQPRTANPAPTRTSAPAPRATEAKDEDDSYEDSSGDDEDDEVEPEDDDAEDDNESEEPEDDDTDDRDDD